MCNCLSGDANQKSTNSLFCCNSIFNSTKPKPKYIDINDSKALEDNNISYKETVSEFEEIYEEVKYLNERL